MVEYKKNISIRGAFVLIALLALTLRSIAVTQERRGFESLIGAAEAVVAVEVLSTDYSATPSDGPMLGSAKVLKGLKGPMTTETEFRFTETAWVGPTYKKGEYRILFLEKAKPTESKQATVWRILSHLNARTDFFIERDSLPSLSLESLESFLRKIEESRDRPKKIVFPNGTTR